MFCMGGKRFLFSRMFHQDHNNSLSVGAPKKRRKRGLRGRFEFGDRGSGGQEQKKKRRRRRRVLLFSRLHFCFVCGGPATNIFRMANNANSNSTPPGPSSKTVRKSI